MTTIDPLSVIRSASLEASAPAGSASAGQSVMTARSEPVTDFASVLAEVASSATQSLRGGEAAAISGIQGKASVQNVVEAMMSAEQTLQAAIAIRDKVVSAYQEISRMAI